jgi:putative ABC transport system permease protein
MQSARRNAALREEMELHLAEKAAELEADGFTTEHARAEARRRFGNVVLKHEESREIWMTRCASELGQDVRYGLRMMVKKPMVTIVAVLTLALGVGANTAIFSIVDAVLLRSLPYRDPDRLVRIYFNEPGAGLRDVRFSKPELDDLQTRSGVFEDVSPIFEGSEDVIGAGQPERVEGVDLPPISATPIMRNPRF